MFRRFQTYKQVPTFPDLPAGSDVSRLTSRFRRFQTYKQVSTFSDLEVGSDVSRHTSRFRRFQTYKQVPTFPDLQAGFDVSRLTSRFRRLQTYRNAESTWKRQVVEMQQVTGCSGSVRGQSEQREGQDAFLSEVQPSLISDCCASKLC